MSFYAADAVWDMSDVGVGTLEGTAATRGFFEDWWAPWEDHHQEIREFQDFGNGVLFAAVQEDGRFAGSDRRVVRLVERAIAAINATDIEGYLAGCTENVKLETPLATVGGVYEGIDGIGRYFTDIEEAGPDFRIELDSVEEVDSKRVVAFLRLSSTGRASGIRLAAPLTNVYDLIGGKISHVRIFVDVRCGA